MRFQYFFCSLSGNKGLRGVPSLSECLLLWGSNGLSVGGKITIGVSSVVVFCILLFLIYICCIRRGHNDYDFGLPQELIGKFTFNSFVPY